MASSAKRPCLDSDDRSSVPSSHSNFAKSHVLSSLATEHVASLTDLCARRVAEKFPFQDVEDRLCRVPEPIQRKIVFFAFPRSEREIELYSSTESSFSSSTNDSNNNTNSRQPFAQAQHLIQSGGVQDVLQIGFHLSGTVHETQGICQQKRTRTYQVSLTFDRCKITMVSCTCSSRGLLWCHHAVALALYRIRKPQNVPVRIPISETVLKLDKQCLQKVLLQLITKHMGTILPSVQTILDDVSCAESEINALPGVPDPTAGACTGSINCWYLDVEHIREEVTAGLKEGNTGKNINSLFNKIYELCTIHDDNAIRLLTLVTEVFMENAARNKDIAVYLIAQKDKILRLLDTLSSLWVSIVLQATDSQKDLIRKQLLSWKSVSHCPLFSSNMSVDGNSGSHRRSGQVTIFEWPLKAMEWNLGSQQDGVICKAAYVEAYRCHGYEDKALALAQEVAAQICDSSMDVSQDSSAFKEDIKEGWLGHSLDPISSVFDLLFDKAFAKEDGDRYLVAAVKVAMFAMMQNKRLPSDRYNQMRICHREEQLIAQLEGLDFASKPLQDVLINCSIVFFQLLQQASTRSDLFPCHTFTRFLFTKLVGLNAALAFDIGISALTLFGSSNRIPMVVPRPTSHVLGHLQSQQAELAMCLLSSCNELPDFITACQAAVLLNVQNPSQLFLIAKNVNFMCSQQLLPCVMATMRDVAFQFGVQLVATSLTQSFEDRVHAIRWLVSCATSIGMEAIEHVVVEWSSYFTAKEFVEVVSPILTSQPTLTCLSLNSKEVGQLMGYLRRIVIECAIQVPEACAMYCLTLCENDPESLDLACQIVNESGHRLEASYLFQIGRYLDGKGHSQKAFKIATLALKQLDIGHGQDSDPAVCDVFWTCALACSLGETELIHITPILLNTVQDAVLLSEIANRCVNAAHIQQGPNHQCQPGTFSYYREPVKRIVECSHSLFVVGVGHRLDAITPKMYNEFVSYLKQVKLCFAKVEEGSLKFKRMTDNILKTQRGKRKLVRMILDAV